MRILANYGHRANGDSYNVTFESTGDQKMENAEQIIDELFRLAREAVSRQIDKDLEFPPQEITIPKPMRNGNGNGKPQIKEPGAPISPKQKSLIIRLAKQKGEFIKDVDRLTKQDASNLIKELMVV